MELYEEEKVVEKKQKGKYLKIGLVISVILLFTFITLMLVLPRKTKEIKQVVSVNGTNKNMPENFYLKQGEGNLYISIEAVANLLGYNYLRGEYIDRYTEDISKCYIEGGEEICSYIAGSNMIYKCEPDSTGQYEYYNIKDSVLSYNNKLYCNVQGIQTGFNVSIKQKDNGFSINTTQNLLNSYKNSVSTKYKNYTVDDKTLENRKAVLNGFIIVINNGKYGVLNTQGEIVIGAKYDAIRYSENTKEFMVKSNNKYGILSTSGETKISLSYDGIALLNDEPRLYYVKRDNYYGVLDRNGRIVVHIEYDSIGVNSSLYPKNKIKNKRLLYDNCIPVKKGEKWGIYNKQGNLIVPIEYDKLGFVVSTTNEKSINNVILIEDIDGIVVGKDKKYGVVNSTGDILIPCEFDKIYSITTTEEDIYYLEKGGETILLDDYIIQNNLKSYKNNTLVKPTEVIKNTEKNDVNSSSNTQNIENLENVENI